jgi:hypothetical protein
MNADRLDGTDWHFRSDASVPFGCKDCYLKETCGGLRVKGAAFDCQRFCCHKKDCQTVCFNSPANYARRLKEIHGFGLENIPRCEPVKFERMQGFVPLIHHAYSRKEIFETELIALSLYELLDRDGAPKYVSLSDISRNFRISPKAKIIISGVHEDRLIERVWSSPHRSAIARMMRSIRVAMFTPPNFSVYNNVVRPENMYNIKRIGLLTQEFLGDGVPTALHINACTDLDYERYAQFLIARPEYSAISFEFITGTGYPSRLWWHVRKLIELQNRLGHQVQLVLRGGTRALLALSAAYADIVLIDSDPLHRALHRQRMIFGNDGRVKVVANRLPKGAPVDELLVYNVSVAKREFEYARRNGPNGVREIWRKKLRIASDRDDKASQASFLANSTATYSRTDAIELKSVISAAEAQRAAQIDKTTKKSPKSTAVPRRLSKPRSTVA